MFYFTLNIYTTSWWEHRLVISQQALVCNVFNDTMNVSTFPPTYELLCGCLPYRGRGGWCGEHCVWLCGLRRTEHYTHWGRPLLLQHRQSLAMTALRPTVIPSASPSGEEEEQTFQKKEKKAKRTCKPRRQEKGQFCYCTTKPISWFLFTGGTFDDLLSKIRRIVS